VLFRARRVSGEEYKESYYAFYLVPKKINPSGLHVLFLFPEAGSEDRNEGSGRCVNPNDSDVITISKPPVEIITEKNNVVRVRFNQVRTNCKTNERFKQTLEYAWQKDGFYQTRNQLEKILRR
jgi:ribosomal protein L36